MMHNLVTNSKFDGRKNKDEIWTKLTVLNTKIMILGPIFVKISIFEFLERF